MELTGPSNFLILGGCGFIGRNLVSYLVENQLVKYLRVVDKVSPQIAWLGKPHADYFQSPNVEFKSSNLINPESCKNAFVPPSDISWDYVINCAGETKQSQVDPVYKEGILKLSINCAKEAAQYQVKRYVELSAGQLFSSSKTPHKESDDVSPWTNIAKWKWQVEKELKEIPVLKYTILRPALVYGPGDKNGLMTRVIIAHLYKQLNETMNLLWNAALKMNTVHVRDVCRAICFACSRPETIGETYNLVDEAKSSQGTLSQLISQLLDIKVDYWGLLVSSMADLESAAEEGNEKHMVAWARACSANAIENTPLSPHMNSEMLLYKHLHLDGSKLKGLGFEYVVTGPSADNIKATVEYYLDMKVFPATLAVYKASNGVV